MCPCVLIASACSRGEELFLCIVLVTMAAMAGSAAMTARIVIVGDVHDYWDALADAKALHYLKPDVVLFTGDFGDENVDVVREVTKLDLPKAVILGNHDCWWTVSPFAKPEEEGAKDTVQEQLELLGKDHVAYGRVDVPNLQLSIVGGRPFSMGGSSIHHAFNPFKLCAARYGVHNFKESAARIKNTALEAPTHHSLIFLAHNGPTGLGSKVNDICGRDWVDHGGDHGDPDFEEAIAAVKEAGVQAPLIVFGHMHKELQCTKSVERTMLVVGPNKTVYLNAAVVPRVREKISYVTRAAMQRHFVLVEFEHKEVKCIHEVWVTVEEKHCEAEERLLYSNVGQSSPL